MSLGLRSWMGLVVVCGATGLVRLISGCSGDSGNNPDATADQTISCGAPLVMCNGTCVDLNADPANCSACGKTCKSGEICGAGVCTLTCGGGSAKCDGGCTDLLGDPGNCGGCGIACDPGHVCNDGGCALTCQTGLTECEIDEDAGDGGTVSVNRCIDTIVDTNNCGGCGNVCEGGTFCSPTDDAGDASCGLGCFGGTLLCNSRCVDPKIDPYNCGGCNSACDGGQSCVSSKCQ